MGICLSLQEGMEAFMLCSYDSNYTLRSVSLLDFYSVLAQVQLRWEVELRQTSLPSKRQAQGLLCPFLDISTCLEPGISMQLVAFLKGDILSPHCGAIVLLAAFLSSNFSVLAASCRLQVRGLPSSGITFPKGFILRALLVQVQLAPIDEVLEVHMLQ
jgi:hypothetical protein